MSARFLGEATLVLDEPVFLVLQMLDLLFPHGYCFVSQEGYDFLHPCVRPNDGMDLH